MLDPLDGLAVILTNKSLLVFPGAGERDLSALVSKSCCILPILPFVSGAVRLMEAKVLVPGFSCQSLHTKVHHRYLEDLGKKLMQ